MGRDGGAGVEGDNFMERDGSEGGRVQDDSDIESSVGADGPEGNPKPYPKPSTLSYISCGVGQYTNLKFQAASLGLGDRWERVKSSYAAANRALGDIVKVRPLLNV
jgi:hypothetical protein